MVTKEHILEWMEHPVTKVLKEMLKERIEDGKQLLVSSDDPDLDRKMKGLVIGYNDVLEWEPEAIDAEVQEGNTGAQSSY